MTNELSHIQYYISGFHICEHIHTLCYNIDEFRFAVYLLTKYIIGKTCMAGCVYLSCRTRIYCTGIYFYQSLTQQNGQPMGVELSAGIDSISQS